MELYSTIYTDAARWVEVYVRTFNGAKQYDFRLVENGECIYAPDNWFDTLADCYASINDLVSRNWNDEPVKIECDHRLPFESFSHWFITDENHWVFVFRNPTETDLQTLAKTLQVEEYRRVQSESDGELLVSFVR